MLSFADRAAEPGAVSVVVDEPVEFEVQQFPGADPGAAQDLDCASRLATSGVARRRPSGHGRGSVATLAGPLREAWRSLRCMQWSARPFGPFP